MVARAGMVDLIAELRQLTYASEDIVTWNNVDYWTDDQLQDILDAHSSRISDVKLVPHPRWYSGVHQYLEYEIPKSVPGWIEGPETQFEIVDNLGNVVDSGDYTFYPLYRRVDFNTDTNGVAYYLRGVSYDMNLAASTVWSKKAGFRSELIDIRGGSFLLKEDQEYQHCLQRAAYFAGKHGFKSFTLQSTGYA